MEDNSLNLLDPASLPFVIEKGPFYMINMN